VLCPLALALARASDYCVPRASEHLLAKYISLVNSGAELGFFLRSIKNLDTSLMA
ncbi:hypothetical protein A2U01_0091082, partial [Trifolium medium]|nr:hypothetical protein [Trifolium medium]